MLAQVNLLSHHGAAIKHSTCFPTTDMIANLADLGKTVLRDTMGAKIAGLVTMFDGWLASRQSRYFCQWVVNHSASRHILFFLWLETAVWGEIMAAERVLTSTKRSERLWGWYASTSTSVLWAIILWSMSMKPRRTNQAAAWDSPRWPIWVLLSFNWFGELILLFNARSGFADLVTQVI